MSLPLRCTVRDCALPLERRDETTLACPSAHAFDRAREGYWNLLQPQDRRSARAGDRAEALAARRKWLARGFADGLIATLHAAASALPLPEGAVAIDVGCGEGTIGTRVLAGLPVEACGVDLSTAGVRMAAKVAPGATWIVANADRALPFLDGSVALALSIFGRRPVDELARVLAAGGFVIAVVPGPDDLVELREAAQGEGARRERTQDVLASFAPAFEIVAVTRWTERARHDREAIDEALAMSYRGERAAERRRLAEVAELGVTLEAEILVLRKGLSPFS